MTTRRELSSAAWLALFGVLGMACGSDAKSPFDPNAFSGMNKAAIIKDCKNTVDCLNQKGEPLPEQPFDNCEENSAKSLDGAGQMKQTEFLRTVALCESFVACDYSVCVETGAFSITHGAEITLDCKNTIDCMSQTGQPVATNAQEVCEGSSGSMLDNANQTAQNSFLQKVSACGNLMACDYYSCAQSGTAFGETQRTNIMYDCAQQIQCMADQGTVVNDYNSALANCVDSTVLQLNVASPDRQNGYQQTFPGCQALASCAFVNCMMSAVSN